MQQRNTRRALFNYLKEPIVLSLLSEAPNYGYSLIDLIHNRYGLHISASTMYPLLDKLAAEGLIAMEWENNRYMPTRKVAAITPTGREHLERYTEELKTLILPLIGHSQLFSV